MSAPGRVNCLPQPLALSAGFLQPLLPTDNVTKGMPLGYCRRSESDNLSSLGRPPPLCFHQHRRMHLHFLPLLLLFHLRYLKLAPAPAGWTIWPAVAEPRPLFAFSSAHSPGAKTRECTSALRAAAIPALC